MLRRNLPGSSLAALIALSLVLSFAAAVAAQSTSSIKGQVIDPEGKPWPGLIVKMSNDRGQKAQTTTDQEGRFVQTGLAGGLWLVQIYRGEQLIRESQIRLTTGMEGEIPVIDFKKLIEADPKFAAEKKKQEDERAKFEGMKANFDKGVAALQAADSLQATLARTPADQRAAVQEQIAAQRQAAIDSFTAAQQGLDEKEPNYALILGNLASAYRAAGKHEEAIATYARALAIKQDAGFYVGMAESQARSNKHAEAMATCEKIPVATHAANAATCYRNLGIVSYNASRDKEAVEALRKATEIEPKNAQAWYVLGASLVRLADYKQEGSKISVTLQPGTVEAYQKALELDPNGPYGAQAKEGLAGLEAMGAGIDTKVRAGKRRN